MNYSRSVAFLRRYWAPLLAACLVPLLVVLALLQLRWIRDLGERERFRMAQGLWATAGQLSVAIQNEIGILPAAFTLDGPRDEDALRSGDGADFARRVETWKEYALDPALARAFHLLRAEADGGTVSVETWNGNAFVPEADAALREALAASAGRRDRRSPFLDPAELGDGTEAFLIPFRGGTPDWLAVRIDRAALTDTLIPLLAERFLVGKKDYRFRIVDRKDGSAIYETDPGSGDFGKPDLSYPLIRPDFRLALSAAAPADGPPGVAVEILRTRRALIASHEDPDNRVAALLEPPRPHERDPAEGARWVLEAVHRSGSLAAAVRTGAAASAALSLGILALLGIALVALAVAARRAQDLAERRSEFIASVTHELKTPLSVLRSASENLADGIVKDEKQLARYGRAMKAESARLGDMIDGLLVYARVGDGRPRADENVDLGLLVDRVLETRAEELKQAKFRTERIAAEGILVRGDPTALELAVGNLVANALAHAREGAFLGVELGAERAKGREWARLAVRDRGPGIPRRERRLVFEAFYRGEAARARQEKGTGIGLNLVKRIARAHGGDVRVEDDGRLGALFVLRLPREAIHAEP